ncbi:Dynein heavy chain [Ostreococcus tauri]|uniref:Dynein-1, subspecies f n=1 Tax=Ostreococcus tauri TaxID=70448 RepID=A0A096PBH2_OSTTA|nr:Dynein heavy chain [Ostreococcus tauri]CEG01942.1 Dynein heavy chain [Ostreococcus tauri]|eukprot:XP_003082801.2 Dynein heavy chain [Ostreococcus tauri]
MMDEFFDGVARDGKRVVAIFAHGQIVRKPNSGDEFVIRLTRDIPRDVRRASVLIRTSNRESGSADYLLPTSPLVAGDDVNVLHISPDLMSLKTLEKFMLGVYSLSMRRETSTIARVRGDGVVDSDSLASDHEAHAHAFMSKLVDASNARQTILYVPENEGGGNVENIVANWTRQLRAALGRNGDQIEDDVNSSEFIETALSPLAGLLQFWPKRAANLRGLLEQVQSEGVKGILRRLASQKNANYLLEDMDAFRESLEYELRIAKQANVALKLVKPSCEMLITAELADVRAILPRLADVMCDAWEARCLEDEESAEDLHVELLKRIGDQIAAVCKRSFDVKDIVREEESSSDDYDKAICTLRECANVAELWKEVYVERTEVEDKATPCVDTTTTFSHLDAFSHRCKDLLELCEAREQFAPPMSRSFPSTDGIIRYKLDARMQVMKRIFISIITEGLANIEYDILDVSTTHWHDDFAAFKSRVKKLEMKLCAIFGEALEQTTTLNARAELLRILHTSVARRDATIRALEYHAARTYGSFAEELQAVKRQFDAHRQKPPIEAKLTQTFGSVQWARKLLHRLEAGFGELRRAHADGALPSLPELIDLLAGYNLTTPQIRLFIDEKYSEWEHKMHELSVDDRLRQPILRVEESGRSCVVYADDLQIACIDARAFASISRNVPIGLREVAFGDVQASHHALRERLLALVDRNNSLLEEIREGQHVKQLFEGNIGILHNLFRAAATELTWRSETSVIDRFCTEADAFCTFCRDRLVKFKLLSSRITLALEKLSGTLLHGDVNDGVRSLNELNSAYKDRVDDIRELFRDTSDAVRKMLRDQLDAIGNVDARSQPWVMYTTHVEESFVYALRKVLMRMLSHFNTTMGRRVCELMPQKPIVLMHFDLKRDDSSNQVETTPGVAHLSNMIQVLFSDALGVYESIPQMSAERSFHERLVDDNREIIHRVWVSVDDSMKIITCELTKLAQHWEERYCHLWSNQAVNFEDNAAIEAHVRHLRESTEDVQSEEQTHVIGFVRVECGYLKQSLLSLSRANAEETIGMLRSKAQSEVQEVIRYFSSSLAVFERTPSNIPELVAHVGAMEKLRSSLESVPATFVKPRETFRVLNQFADITETESELLASIDGEFEEFKALLETVESNLVTTKDVFKKELQVSISDLEKDSKEYHTKFALSAPTQTHPSCTQTACDNAWAFIESVDEALTLFNERAKVILSGLVVFKELSHPFLDDIEEVRSDLEQLKFLWQVVRGWNTMYEGWKDGKFNDLDVDSMEGSATLLCKKITKLGRGKVKNWGAWISLKETVDSFKRITPLIIDMRNPAIRQRHWELVMDACGQRFDPESDAFTLDKVVELGLDHHAEAISEISTDATKELSVENTLRGIANEWTNIALDTGPFKEGRDDVMKLRSAEDIFNALEDHTVTLSTLKASKFFSVFEHTITSWEKTLGMVNDVVEMVLKVQLAWMYLENIFIGSDDIARQLPKETETFGAINVRFIDVMQEMHRTSNVVSACTAAQAPDINDTPDDKLLLELSDMDAKLELIQKSLDDYLESKRQAFPRFYFLSNDDLLQILGQAKEPENIQPHLKGMFEGIKKLKMHAPDPLTGRKHYESVAMTSPDGETIPFDDPIRTEGRPEEWLNTVEAAMYAATKSQLASTYDARRTKGVKKDKWVKDNPGQMLITAGCIAWTTECERALRDPEDVKDALKKLRRKWIQYLNKLVELTRTSLDKVTRKKVTALITIEVHARDAIEKLIRSGCSSPSDFEWISQLRFYWDRETKHCTVKQVLSVFDYGYEYQGNNGRLVVTPLTDRCYMTLGAAMFTRRGGNPLGPAGTGKTETVKDFGKALARYVIVFNCSDGVDYKMTGKMFSGLAQTGAWACLDEFNRITVEVLSVVATQISVVMAAVKQNLTMFEFEGQRIRLIPSCGVFVTMNPGYAGRAELPDNLKAIVRPVSMMVPDFCLIAEIMMFSEGFTNAKSLAKKMVAIMELSQQQLSKQDHYDYTLRSFIIPISRAAGTKKRETPNVDEHLILFNAMRDLIIPKLVYIDIPLFKALITDLFPDVSAPQEDSVVLREALIEECKHNNLQPEDAWISKIVQIFDCKTARHGNMIVGKTGSGKTRAREMLMKAMARLKQNGVHSENFQNVELYPINPLALSNDELYGSFDQATHEWSDGVLAKIMRDVCKDESPNQKWIIMDGPVDTLWIESMNTLLDDNKLLTLLSGERIMMSSQVSILFEVEDLSQASPATVSRAGMIYFNVEDLGWQPYILSWQSERKLHGDADEIIEETLSRCIDKYINEALEFKRMKCTELVQTDQLANVRQFTTLFDAHTVSSAEHVEAICVFSLVWSIGGSIDHASRIRFDDMLHRIMPPKLFPHTPASAPTDVTVFDFYYDNDRCAFLPWVEKIPTYHLPHEGLPFFKIMIPTIDSVRTKHVASLLLGAGSNTLIVGNVGVGKSMVVDSLLTELPEGYVGSRITFSAQTSSNSLQETVEGKLEKRSKGSLAPPGGRKLVLAIDDLNMPKKSEFGFIPPLELLKLWNDNGFWYDRSKQERTYVNDMKLLAAMAPPGGGRNQFSQRILSMFAVLNMTDPSESQLERIYGTILGEMQSDFDQSIASLGSNIAKASIAVFNSLVCELLPTPTKSHYLFNTRDLSKVIQGVTRATKQFYDSKESILQLWIHENMRVYGDRLWDLKDVSWLQRQIDSTMQVHFGTSWNETLPSSLSSSSSQVTRSKVDEEFHLCPQFVSFMRQGVDAPPYEVVGDVPALKEFLSEKLEDYGLEAGNAPMDLVLFSDAMTHVCRIHRVLTQPRGHALLVGVGGSGRKSLARLAAYVAEMTSFSIEITKNYKQLEFREDIKVLYRQTGVTGKPTVFILDDTQIVKETFLEDVNNALTSGEIPGLFAKDEVSAICEDMRKIAKAQNIRAVTHDELFAFFMERVMQNLHIVLCMSPVGDAFRERTRMFPGLVNCCTIDWFNDWPVDALKEVAAKKLQGDDVESRIKDDLCEIFGKIHASTTSAAADMFYAIKRKMYVTPTNYIEFVNFFRALMVEKKRELNTKIDKLQGGLTKLAETEVQVRDMQSVCKDKAKVVAEAKTDCEKLLKVIVQDKRAADEQSMRVSAEAERIEVEAQKANVIAEECQLKLDEALPALREAEAALNVLTKKDMGELKSYVKPPALVELCLKGVLTVLKRPTTWDEAKKQLGDSGFLERLLHFDKDTLVDGLLTKMAKFVNNPDYQPDVIGKVSNAAKGLCKWVHAMFSYGNVAREIAPKRLMLKQAQDQLTTKQDDLALTQASLAEVMAKVAALKENYEKSASNKASLESELADLELKLERAEALVDGLSGEKKRWASSIEEFSDQIVRLPGDVCIAAAFMSYAGAFPSEYRTALIVDSWVPMLKETGIPCSSGFDFAKFLADPSDVRDWNIQGLPADSFSTENGVIVTRGNRWPLLIDPQGQGNKWIKSMEASNGLIVTALHAPDMVRQVEHAVQFGVPILIQDIKETIDPILENVVAKAFIKKGGSMTVKLGDKELDYSSNFRLYFTTKMMNPHYTPEVSTKLAVINFTVKEQGLNAQLRDLVVRRERPELDAQKNELVVKVARGKRKLSELEDLILDLLSKASGSLLDNIELIDSLTRSKNTSEEVTVSLKIAETTGAEIERAAAAYAPAAIRATMLYFTLYSLADIDPMYQFSLDAYTSLFDSSITKSKRNTSAGSDEVDARLNALNEYHTYAVYRYTSRGLFESHKLLLSLQMCVQIHSQLGRVPPDEWQYFVSGGERGASGAHDFGGTDMRDETRSWLNEDQWSNVLSLSISFEKVLGTLPESINETHTSDWEGWFRHSKPETQALPGGWEKVVTTLQRLLILRSLRLDRVESGIRRYVAENLGPKFIDPPVLNLNEVYFDSTCAVPCIFVLSSGVDPTANLKQLAASRDMSDKLFSVALGQGQASIATELIDRGRKEGHWVFLANCHLMTSWLPKLQEIIENFDDDAPHENFRLWLSSNPTPDFPLAILQRSLKMTTEPPKGLRANLARLYSTCVSDESFSQCAKRDKYGRLLFSLSFFHALLLERRKFGTLGLNIPYDFNDTDFSVSDDLLKSYLDGYEETPWDALRYLIGEANYGGRITDEIDRRVIKAYLLQFFCEDVLMEDDFALTSGALGKVYRIPSCTNELKNHREFVNKLPLSDQAEAFGQHPNADISYMIAESEAILRACTKFHMADAGSSSASSQASAAAQTESRVLQIIEDMLKTVPVALDYESIANKKKHDMSPLNVNLLQEIERYNTLLSGVHSSLNELKRGIKGLIVMSNDLDDIFHALAANKVPKKYLKAYPSLKPLSSWTLDLVRRVEQMSSWAHGTYPKTYWLAGFTYPTCFLTSVLQASARKDCIPIDALSFTFSIVDENVDSAPDDGVFVSELYLEGAGWDCEKKCLREPNMMELIVKMPVLHFKPTERKRKSSARANVFECPLYMYPVRTGTRERPSFITMVELDAGDAGSEHWVKRGTALLLSLAN